MTPAKLVILLLFTFSLGFVLGSSSVPVKRIAPVDEYLIKCAPPEMDVGM